MTASAGVAVVLVALAGLSLGNKRLTPAVRTYALQSLLLGGLVALEGWRADSPTVLAFGVALAAVKGIATPAYLQWVSRRLAVERELDPVLNIPLSFLAAGGALLLALRIGDSLGLEDPDEATMLVAGLSTVFLGLLNMATHRKALPQALGLLTMENGAFLLSLALLGGLPFTVELAVLLDVLVLVILVGILVDRIRETFSHVDVSNMMTLGE